MNTKSVSIQKQKAQSSNVDHFNHQLQVSDGKNENQEQYHQAKEVSFEPPQQRRLHGKAVADTCSLKYNHNYIGYTRFRERVHDVQYAEEATNVCFKRTKGDKESCIPRSSGSKNRHCKVPTPNGLRDRRVRLSANTAIEFYDVQDRLGFDRSSNAIDWLMKEAEAAINALGKEVSIAQLPCHVEKEIEEHLQNQTRYESQLQSGFLSSEYNINQNDQQLIDDSNFSFISLLCGSNSSTSISFPSYHHGFDPSMKNHNEHLCLSLQTFQDDPTLLQQNLNPYALAEPDNSISLGSTPINFNLSPNPHWFHKVIDQSSNLKQPLNSQERHSGPFHEQQEMCSQRESLQPTILPSTNNSFTKTDCDWIPLCNTSSTGLVNNEFPISIRGQGETSKPISISSSATKTFLHYQEYQN